MSKHIERLKKHPKYETIPGYWQRHETALTAPSERERGIAGMLRAWLLYADDHKARFGSGIGDDGVLGPEWAAIGAAMLGLLNGELGRLDGGSLDATLRDALNAEGFDPDKL